LLFQEWLAAQIDELFGVGVACTCQAPARVVRSIEVPGEEPPTSGELTMPVSSTNPLVFDEPQITASSGTETEVIELVWTSKRPTPSAGLSPFWMSGLKSDRPVGWAMIMGEGAHVASSAYWEGAKLAVLSIEMAWAMLVKYSVWKPRPRPSYQIRVGRVRRGANG